MSTPTLLDLLRATTERTPAAPATIVAGQVVNYRHLHALVCVAARDLRARGIVPGEVVALSMGQGPLAIIVLLALAHLGAVSISMAPGLGAARLALCQRFSARRVVVTDRASAVEGLETVMLDRLDAQGNETMRGLDDFTPNADTPMRIALTSGTTGEPKGIVQTHGYLAHRLHHSLWNTGPASRILPPDLHEIASLMMCFSALRDGGVLVFPKAYTFPEMLLAVQLHGVTHLALSPATLAALVTLLQTDSPAFPSLTHLRIMGGTPSAALLARVRRRITPHVYLPYAMNEVGVVSMATPEILAREPRSSGLVASHACVEVVDESGRLVPQGGSGELRIAVEGMPQAYHASSDTSRFREGWFYPGDRGRIGMGNLLYIEGRADDVFNVGGHKVAATYVEAILEEHESVQEAAVFSTESEGEGRLEAAIVTPTLDPEGLTAHAMRRLGSVFAPVRYHVVQSLPRNESGKIRRGELAASVAAQTGVAR